VRRRDGRQRIGERDARFEEVGLAVVLKLVGREMFRAEAEIRHDVRVVDALVADIVDRQHAGSIRQRRENTVPGLRNTGAVAVGQSWHG